MSYDALLHLGVPVHHRDLGDVLDQIEQFIEIGRRTGRSHQVVTVNTDFLVQAWHHLDVHAILRTADLAIPDGMPIVWASAAMGQRLPSRLAGADLVPALAARAARSGHRIMLFGGAEGVADRAADQLRGAHPDLVVATACALVATDGTTPDEVLDQIRAFAPDVICVALGHPKQERWIRRHGARLGIPVGIGVGGTFDFIAGERRRASPLVQRVGLEWLHRLTHEPGRLSRRYLHDIAVYLPRMTAQIVQTRLANARTDRHDHTGDDLEILRADSRTIVASLVRPGPLGHRCVATLTSLACCARRDGIELQIVVPDRRALKSIERLRLDRLVTLVPDRPHDVSLTTRRANQDPALAS